MNDIQIITDSCCDLPMAIREQYGIRVVPMGYTVGDASYTDDAWASRNVKEFYDDLRAGGVATTSQVTANEFCAAFRESLDNGRDVLYIGFSSMLSGTFNAASLARKMTLKERPDAQIHLVDSLSASMGLGLLILEAARLIEQGTSLAAVIEWIETHKLRLNHWFTVDDLEHLRRGGRVSHLASAVGSLLQVKPVLRVDEQGRLVPCCKVRGRRKALDELSQRLLDGIVEPEGQTIAISHGDSEEDAKRVQERLREQLPSTDCIVSTIGPVIGTHAGPGTVAIFFWGQNRS